MRFYFLPPYSPELNRIEILWKKMKYEWLPFKSFSLMNSSRRLTTSGPVSAQNTN
jgi:transposase